MRRGGSTVSSSTPSGMMNRANLTGYHLFRLGNLDCLARDNQAATEYYRQSIETIIAREDITQSVPPRILERMARANRNPSMDLIWLVWRNMIALMIDPRVGVTPSNSPKAYELVTAFKSDAKAHRAPFEKHGARGLYIYKAMQVSALTTLGLRASYSVDRATAAKRYKQALALVESEPAFLDPAHPAADGIAKAVYSGYAKVCRLNLATVIINDAINSAVLGDKLIGRKETRVVPLTRSPACLPAAGSAEAHAEITFATDVCRGCGKRDVGMNKCSKCRGALYCGKACQQKHWGEHKKSCGKPLQ